MLTGNSVEDYEPPKDLVDICLSRDPKFDAFLAKHDPESNYTSATDVGMVFCMDLGLDVFCKENLVPRLTWEEEKKLSQELKESVMELQESTEAEDLQEAASAFSTAILSYLGLARGSLEFPLDPSFEDKRLDPGDFLLSSIAHWRDFLSDYQLQEVTRLLQVEANSWAHPGRSGWFVLQGIEEG